jgi:hypothetical protein
MSSIFGLIILVACVAAAYFIYKRRKGSGGNNLAEKSSDNPVSQEIYNAKKHPKEEDVSLTLEERVELSWHFLTNITEQILNKFTAADRNTVHSAGEKLNKHGMNYQHDVKQEAKITIDIVKSKTRSKSKGQSR